MKNIFILIVVSISWICNKAYSQVLPELLIGEWIYSGTEYKHNFIECPSIISFNDDGNYIIFNHCFGIDSENPVLEKGNWNFNQESKLILLFNRKFYSDFPFYDFQHNMLLFVGEATEVKIKLWVNNKDSNFGEIFEKYRKIR